ncbi:MAG: T9SS type A sorting domain-containing protein [Bacteroidia bacterium]
MLNSFYEIKNVKFRYSGKNIYKIIFLLLLSSVLRPPPSFSQIIFQKTFGGSSNDMGNAVDQTFDGGYIVGGMTQSFGSGNFDMYLLKTNAAGDTIWTRVYGKSTDDRIKSVHQTADSGYIFSGYINYDTYLVKTNDQGYIQWIKNYGYGTGGGSGGNCVQQTFDGGYILTGSSVGIGPGNYDVYLIKTNFLGDTLWIKSYGDTGGEQATSVIQTADKGYLMAGSSILTSTNYDAYILKTDSIGDTLWTKYYGFTGINENDLGFDAIQTNDGGYALVGRSDSVQTFLLKTDSIGMPVWCKSYSGGYSPPSPSNPNYIVRQTTDNGFFITSKLGSKCIIIKTDSTGNIQWTKLFTKTTNGYPILGMPASDGGYVMVSSTNSAGAGSYDFIFIKTDSLGNSGCNDSSVTITEQNVTMPLAYHVTIVSQPGAVNLPPEYYLAGGSIMNTLCSTVGIPEPETTYNNLQFSPNPLTTQSTLTFSNPRKNTFHFTLYDITGRVTEAVSTVNNKIILEKGNKEKGVYLFRLQNVSTAAVINGKIVVSD